MKSRTIQLLTLFLATTALVTLVLMLFDNPIVQLFQENDTEIEYIMYEQVDIQNLQDNDFVLAEIAGQNIELEVAVSDFKKSEGLMNRTSMDEDKGMLFIYNSEGRRSFWMKNTLISLDIIFLNSDLEIVTIHENTKTDQTSETYPSTSPAQYVVELNAGWSQEHGLKVGDSIEIKGRV